jgi:hypothetical protein
MVKILKGSCVGTVVTSTSVPPEIIVGCTILGAGLGASTGIIILSDVDAVYIPQISGDITTIINQLSADLTSLGSAITAMQSALIATGFGSASAAAAAAAVSQLTTSVAALTALLTTQR